MLANVIIWKVVQHLIPTLPLEFRAANEKYYQDAFKRKPTSRWKNCITLTDKAFQFATTLLYVNDHVSNASLETVRDDVITLDCIDGRAASPQKAGQGNVRIWGHSWPSFSVSSARGQVNLPDRAVNGARNDDQELLKVLPFCWYTFDYAKF